MYIQKYISSNISQNAKLSICRAYPPNLKLCEDPQDLSQSHWNFHTLLIMYRDNFPSPLYICTPKKVFSLHPSKQSDQIIFTNSPLKIGFVTVVSWVFILKTNCSRVSARKEKHPECKTIQYSISSTRRQQLDETHALPTDVTGFTRNGGVPDFVAQQQMPTYSVFVGENGYNAVA